MNSCVEKERGSNFMDIQIVAIVSLVLAVAGAILAFIFIMPAKKRSSLPKFLQVLHDIFTFKGLMIEAILRFLYVFYTFFCIVAGFLLLFGIEVKGYQVPADETFKVGLFLMILGPIFLRLAFELLMLAVLLVKNVIEINKKLSKKTGETKAPAAPAAPSVAAKCAAATAPAAPARPAPQAAPARYAAPVVPAPAPVKPAAPVVPAPAPVQPAPVAPAPAPVKPAAPVVPAPAPVAPAPAVVPAAPEKPAAEPSFVFCTECGTRYDENKGNCPNCGKN